jgi:uncharacterized protein
MTDVTSVLVLAENRWLAPLQAIIREHLDDDPSHDFSHFCRVWNNAKLIAGSEAKPVDGDILICAVWLHDIVNLPKDHPEVHLASRYSGEKAVQLLAPLAFPPEKFEALKHAIAAHSYSAKITPQSYEAKIVQDADRLESVGAIAIARTFASCGTLRRALVDVADPLAEQRAPNNALYGVDLFLTRMPIVAAGMQTLTGQRVAAERFEFNRQFCAQIAKEVRGLTL